jgi:exodeoxyribonuclease VII large subunit
MTFAELGASGDTALSVSVLTRRVAEVLQADPTLAAVWVAGEVSDFRRATSGHIYFRLRDAEAALNCVMWRGDANRLAFRPGNGDHVTAHGRVTVYVARGEYQLQVSEMRPAGQGALLRALEELRMRLAAEGLLDPARKRALPPFPDTVVVVTSLAGAAVRDICVTLHSADPPPAIVLVDAQVQGAGAPAAIAAAVDRAARIPGADVVIVGRGGGAMEDLWAFNSEAVARAIASCPVPVIAAVGHETDVTLADQVADVRVATPTAAGELVVAMRGTLLQRLHGAQRGVVRLVYGRIREARAELDGLGRHWCLAHPEWMVNQRRQRLDDCEARAVHAAERGLAEARNRLGLAAARANALNPLQVLARGYAAVSRQADGRPVVRRAEVEAGELLRLTFADGSVRARAEE